MILIYLFQTLKLILKTNSVRNSTTISNKWAWMTTDFHFRQYLKINRVCNVESNEHPLKSRRNFNTSTIQTSMNTSLPNSLNSSLSVSIRIISKPTWLNRKVWSNGCRSKTRNRGTVMTMEIQGLAKKAIKTRSTMKWSMPTQKQKAIRDRRAIPLMRD